MAAGLGRWGRRWYQLVLGSCPAVSDLSQLIVARSLEVPDISFHTTA